MQAIAERVTELDVADLRTMAEVADEGDGAFSGTAGLAAMVGLAGQQPWLTRTKARYELAMEAGREPDLAEVLRHSSTRFHELARQAIAQWQTAEDSPDPALLDEQTYAVLRFVDGVLLEFCRGDGTDLNTDQIDRLIQAVIAGVRMQHRI